MVDMVPVSSSSSSLALSAYKKVRCPICWREVVQIDRGRPRSFHPRCRKIEQLFSWLDTELTSLDPLPEGKRRIRSRLWYLANLVNAKKR